MASYSLTGGVTEVVKKQRFKKGGRGMRSLWKKSLVCLMIIAVAVSAAGCGGKVRCLLRIPVFESDPERIPGEPAGK